MGKKPKKGRLKGQISPFGKKEHQLVEKVYKFRVSYWFSLPFAYKRKQGRGVSPPVGERVKATPCGLTLATASPYARSARGASLAQHITACYKRNVTFCAKLTIDQSPHTPRAGARQNAKKALKGCGARGDKWYVCPRQEFSPTVYLKFTAVGTFSTFSVLIILLIFLPVNLEKSLKV